MSIRENYVKQLVKLLESKRLPLNWEEKPDIENSPFTRWYNLWLDPDSVNQS